MNINWDNRKEILEKLSHADCVKFAIKAASLVSHLNDDPSVTGAIEAAENWLANPSDKNRKTASTAADAAYAAGTAYDAGTAAKAATYAAYAATLAAYAAAAADVAVNADPNVKPILVKYLRELYLNSLPEEIRNDWLTRAVIGVNYETV